MTGWEMSALYPSTRQGDAPPLPPLPPERAAAPGAKAALGAPLEPSAARPWSVTRPLPQ